VECNSNPHTDLKTAERFSHIVSCMIAHKTRIHRIFDCLKTAHGYGLTRFNRSGFEAFQRSPQFQATVKWVETIPRFGAKSDDVLRRIDGAAVPHAPGPGGSRSSPGAWHESPSNWPNDVGCACRHGSGAGGRTSQPARLSMNQRDVVADRSRCSVAYGVAAPESSGHEWRAECRGARRRWHTQRRASMADEARSQGERTFWTMRLPTEGKCFRGRRSFSG